MDFEIFMENLDDEDLLEGYEEHLYHVKNRVYPDDTPVLDNVINKRKLSAGGLFFGKEAAAREIMKEMAIRFYSERM